MIENVHKLKCWIIGEGLAGTENQCIGVAEALGITPEIRRLRLREPWKSVSPWLSFEQWWSFDPLLQPPWPDLVIAAGRKGIAPARYIKRVSGGKSFTVFLQDPKCDPADFDLVAVPEHDSLRGDNVITTYAAPNRITAARLQDALSAFPQLKTLPSPRAAVLIGGNSKTHTMSDAVTDQLIAQLKDLDAGSLMITTSRRTPPQAVKKIRKSFKNENNIVWSGEKDGPNPYFAFLAAADFIIATNDSASMLSESATTGKPLYSVALEGGSPKFDRLYKNLEKHGCLRAFTGKLETWAYEPLNDAQKVANTIISALQEK